MFISFPFLSFPLLFQPRRFSRSRARAKDGSGPTPIPAMSNDETEGSASIVDLAVGCSWLSRPLETGPGGPKVCAEFEDEGCRLMGRPTAQAVDAKCPPYRLRGPPCGTCRGGESQGATVYKSRLIATCLYSPSPGRATGWAIMGHCFTPGHCHFAPRHLLVRGVLNSHRNLESHQVTLPFFFPIMFIRKAYRDQRRASPNCFLSRHEQRWSRAPQAKVQRRIALKSAPADPEAGGIPSMEEQPARLGLGPKVDNPPHNVNNMILGTALLWIGWFGFNGGSALGGNRQLRCRGRVQDHMPSEGQSSGNHSNFYYHSPIQHLCFEKLCPSPFPVRSNIKRPAHTLSLQPPKLCSSCIVFLAHNILTKLKSTNVETSPGPVASTQ